MDSGKREGESVTIPPRTAHAFQLQEGNLIKVVAPEGGQWGDFTFIGFDQSLTRNINGWEKFGKIKLTFFADAGMKLYDGEGVPCLEVIEVNSDYRIDIMYPGCFREVYDDGRPGCRDLLAEALGIERRELTGMASFWVTCEVDRDGYMFKPLDVKAGDYLILKALRPVSLAVSACPDDNMPGVKPANLVSKDRAGRFASRPAA